MALSFYSNWEPMDSPGQFYDPQSELDGALIGLYDPIDVPLDSLFDPPVDNPVHFAEPAVSSSLLPSFSDPSIISLLTEQYPLINDDFDFCRCPKRPRSCSDLYQPLELMFEPGAPSVSPAIVSGGWPSLEFAVPPPPLTAGMCDGEKKASGGEGLSAQSVAARERRKRISEKTQELGRLIPGGNKMNTAEMFQAAFKYVKFLQAQVGILGLMGSMQDAPSSSVAAENLKLLLKSQNLQEKLSSEEKCIVPKEMVDTLAKDIDVRSSPFIFRDLHRFMESMENK